MGARLAFIVNGAPVPWQRATPRAGGAFTPPETRAYQGRVAWAARAAVGATPWPVSATYRVSIVACCPDHRRRDVDNVAKSILDACTSILWSDDSAVAELHITRRVDRVFPRAEVTVEVLDVDAGKAA